MPRMRSWDLLVSVIRFLTLLMLSVYYTGRDSVQRMTELLCAVVYWRFERSNVQTFERPNVAKEGATMTIETIVAEAVAQIEASHAARERALATSRALIRQCANAI